MEIKLPRTQHAAVSGQSFFRLMIQLAMSITLMLVVSACGGSAATSAPAPTDAPADGVATQAVAVTPYNYSKQGTPSPFEKVADNAMFFFSQTTRDLRLAVLTEIITAKGGEGCANAPVSAKVTQKKDDAGVWVEEWVLKICDTEYTFTITFTPDGDTWTYEYVEAE